MKKMTMEIVLSLASVLLISACSNDALGSALLGSAGGGFGIGARDKQIEPGVWQITSRSPGSSANRAVGLALKRAANVVTNAGGTYIQILKSQVTENSIRGRGGAIGGDVSLVVAAASDPQAPYVCRDSNPSECSVISVAEAQQRAAALSQ